MEFWSQISSLQSKWNLLEHSFYQRWNSGELSAAELACYSGEYRHAVVALADASARAAASASDREERALLAAHAEEEANHVRLWDGFLHSVGGDVDQTPLSETASCINAWVHDDDLCGQLVTLFAIEAGQPEISKTKAAGLRAHYGFETGAATAYFDLHAERDIAHAEEARALLDRHRVGVDEAALLDRAERVLKANWELLDGVERAHQH